MSDIVERLRRIAKELPQTSGNQAWLKPEDTTVWEAADEIEKLRAENANLAASNHAYLSNYQEAAAEIEKLRAALRLAIDSVEFWASYTSPYFQENHNLAGDLQELRAALGEKK